MRGPIIYAAVVGTTAALALAGCGSSGSGGYGGGGDASSSTSTQSGYGTTMSQGTSSATATAATSTISTAKGKLGTHLVDSQGRTLYLWLADKGAKSTCSGACAQAWPPSIAKGRVKATHGAKSTLLGTTTRSGGAKQVTYNGHPLYRYAGDGKAGQTNGQGNTGFGAAWYVVSPAGSRITTH